MSKGGKKKSRKPAKAKHNTQAPANPVLDGRWARPAAMAVAAGALIVAVVTSLWRMRR